MLISASIYPFLPNLIEVGIRGKWRLVKFVVKQKPATSSIGSWWFYTHEVDGKLKFVDSQSIFHPNTSVGWGRQSGVSDITGHRPGEEQKQQGLVAPAKEHVPFYQTFNSKLNKNNRQSAVTFLMARYHNNFISSHMGKTINHLSFISYLANKNLSRIHYFG